MQYVLEERIGDPDLFCGRETEMSWLMEWASRIPKRIAKSQALLGRRKSGKTAIMQRLFNILWSVNGNVIPFYFEVKDENQWLLDFARSYFYTFLTQYFSFIYRKQLPIDSLHWRWDQLLDMASEHGNKDILDYMKSFETYVNDEDVNLAKNFAFAAPAGFSGFTDKFFLVMIDEIQYMTEFIYYDNERKVKAYNLPGAFHGLVELKFAPMLVSGSYIGWMTQMMRKMFVGSRLRPYPISPKLDDKGGLEAVYKYSDYYDIQLTDEVAHIINLIIQSDPFYMTALFNSPFRDFSSVDGVIQTFVQEISNKKGELYLTWMEYIDISLKKVNDRYAKQILLILSKNRYQEMGRDEILQELGWSEDRDSELEEKLLALEYGGLIEGTSSNYHYQGISDDILDLIFRERYHYEIYREKFDIASELRQKVQDLEKNNRSLKGQVNELKGRMLELTIWRELNSYRKKGQIILHLEKRFRPMEQSFKHYPILEIVKKWPIAKIYINYYIQSPETVAMEIDILVECTTETTYNAIVFEIKNTDEKKCPAETDVQLFAQKIDVLKYALTRQGCNEINLVPIYLSANGFQAETEKWLHDKGIFTADIQSWGINI
ncbi:ATPase domain protein, prokaryote domain protein [Candidatus Magnetomorum sp. HK-1]|nr:ATPase domain protein, prokaryote domain protein [Candidatus Magnetomorum sp. HK-1]